MRFTWSDLWRLLLDIVYPPHCPACRGGVRRHGEWCRGCFTLAVEVRRIPVEIYKLSHLSACWAVAHYAGPVRRLMHELKFRRLRHNARYLRSLLRQADVQDPFVDVDVVIPIPLHELRQQERGYDQNHLLFRPWVEELGIPWEDKAVLRQRMTGPQWELGIKARKKNLAGAFQVVKPEAVRGKRILLVDDIFTSGTTLEECARVLRRAGAAEVQGLVIAAGAPPVVPSIDIVLDNR